MQFGAYTFVETRRDPATGEPVDVDKTFAERHRADRACGPRRPRRVRARRASSAGLRGVGAGGGLGRGGRAHQAHSLDERGHRAVVGRSGARLSAIRHPRSHLGRAGRNHGRTRLVHRVLPAVRLRPQRLRRAVRREARPPACNPRQPQARGKALIARRSRARASTRARCNNRCRSGSPRAARRNRSRAPARSAAAGDCDHRRRAGALRPLAELYREAGHRAGVAPEKLKVGINGHGFLADTAEAAVEAFFGPYAEVMSRIGRERGWPPLSRAQFDRAGARAGI